MTRIPRLLALLLAIALPAQAQSVPDLIPQPDLASDAQAFPRLKGGGAAVEQINFTLAKDDAAMAAALQDCPDVTRVVETTQRGPGFISFHVTESGMCEGAAHPYVSTWVASFDLTNGSEVDWLELLPEALLQTKALDWDQEHPFASAALNAAYRAGTRLVPECEALYAGGLEFQFWLSAKDHALAMEPDFLPHAERACGEVALIPVEQLRLMGTDARLIAALEQGQP